MFQTSHPYSSFHAAGRCISGGPIYFTDEPGKHDIDLIAQMTAQTTHGKTVILRPTVIGKSIGVYTSYYEARLLRVGAYSGAKGVGTGLLALFNVNERVLTEFVNIKEFPGVENGQEYVVRGHRTGELTNLLSPDAPMAVLSLEVAVKGWEILSAYPVRSFQLSQGRGSAAATKVAVLGLLGKMTGAAAVLHSEIRMEGNGRLWISSSIKALGVLGKYPPDHDRSKPLALFSEPCRWLTCCLAQESTFRTSITVASKTASSLRSWAKVSHCTWSPQVPRNLCSELISRKRGRSWDLIADGATPFQWRYTSARILARKPSMCLHLAIQVFQYLAQLEGNGPAKAEGELKR